MAEDGHNPPDLLPQLVRALNGGLQMKRHTCSVKQSKRVRIITNHDRDGVIVKHLQRTDSAVSDISMRKGRRTVGTYSLGNLFVV